MRATHLSEEMLAKVKESRRLACYRITAEFLPLFFREGEAYLVRSGLPADAILIQSSWDENKAVFVLMFWSGTFDPLPEGSSVPFKTITFERLSPEIVRAALSGEFDIETRSWNPPSST